MHNHNLLHPRPHKIRKNIFESVGKMKNKKLFLLGFLPFLAYGIMHFRGNEGEQKKEEEVLGIQSFAEGDFEKSVEHLEKAGKEKDSEAELKLAVSYYNKKEYEKARENYEKVIEKDPNNLTAYNGLGNLFRDQKNNEKAEEYYRKALEINDKYTLAYSNLAIMFLDNGQLDEAKNIIEKGLEKVPDSTTLKNIQGFTIEK